MQQGPHHKLIPLILLPEQITIIKCQGNVYPSYNMIVLGASLFYKVCVCIARQEM